MYNICLFVSDLNRKTSWGILCASLLVDPTGAARHMSRLANISDDLWLEHPNLHHLGVSWNGKYPQGFSIINQRSWGIPIYGTPESGFFSWFFLRSQYSSSTRRPYDPVANSTSWHVGRALWSSAHLVPLLGTFRTVPSCGQQKQDLIVPHLRADGTTLKERVPKTSKMSCPDHITCHEHIVYDYMMYTWSLLSMKILYSCICCIFSRERLSEGFF